MMTYFTEDGSRLHVAVHREGDRATATVTGELDLLSGPFLVRLLDTAMGDGTKHLEVVASQLDFVDVAGVRALAAAHRLAADRGVTWALRDALPNVIWLLRTVDGAGVLLGDKPTAGGMRTDPGDPGDPGGSSPPAGGTAGEWSTASAAARADERDRLADARDRRADERDERSDDRDRIAGERDRLAEEREDRVREHQRWEDLREDLADARERDLERREGAEQ